jgi:hypothetical protein
LIGCVGFEVLRAVLTENSVFWDIASCSAVKVEEYFGGERRLHLQRRRIIQARNHHEAGRKQSLAYSSSLKNGATCSSEKFVRLLMDYTALYPRR